jgi:hypothetical protein
MMLLSSLAEQSSRPPQTSAEALCPEDSWRRDPCTYAIAGSTGIKSGRNSSRASSVTLVPEFLGNVLTDYALHHLSGRERASTCSSFSSDAPHQSEEVYGESQADKIVLSPLKLERNSRRPTQVSRLALKVRSKSWRLDLHSKGSNSALTF